MGVKENPEEKAPEKPPSPKESPHFYRKGTTPPGSPEESPRQSPQHSPEPSPAKQVKKQNSTSQRLIQEKKNITENTIPVANKPLPLKSPVKEEILVKQQPKLSPHRNPTSTDKGELHDHYHGYYVKTNPTLYPYELGEDESHANPSSSALALVASAPKPSPGLQLDAKESIKKPEFTAPKNPANNNFHSSVEREINSLLQSTEALFMVLLPEAFRGTPFVIKNQIQSYSHSFCPFSNLIGIEKVKS
uniref:Uncharacterized protein n=1 Tax=Sphaerodactylus townsendi TaxID=933632 RepID=A0ACB8FDI9_9SAUR